MGKFLIAEDQNSVSVDIKSREFGTVSKPPLYDGTLAFRGEVATRVTHSGNDQISVRSVCFKFSITLL